MFFGRHDKGIMIYFLGFVKLDFGLQTEQKRDAGGLPPHLHPSVEEKMEVRGVEIGKG